MLKRTPIGGKTKRRDIQPKTIAIACASKMISSVLSSVAEAELCDGFKIAHDAVKYRRIANDLGYPQPAYLLRLGNTVAIGLAQGTINAKRSNAMDM
jgi:hypothetical protein